MRKFLSLVLALVMMMSLVTINAGAKEFTDADDITYVEAVDVISAINVMDGYEGGGFSPAGNLTRGAAAKIICNLILGPTTAAELHADTAPYRDVPVNHTFAGYIAYCQKEGIVSGYADGSFRPAGTLTGYAFMKMLLGALGYDAEIEGYVGPNWSINVAKRAIGIGLNKSLVDAFNGVDYITREEAALYAFNTLKADLVEYDQKITATVNGAAVTVGNSNAKPQEWNSQQTRRNNIYNDSIVQFAEQYFNKLVLTEDMDVFGRPDREWKFDGDEIGAYVNYDLFKQEYTAKVTGKDLYELLGSSTVDEDDGYEFEIHVDGEYTKEVLKPNDATNYGYFTQGNLVRTNTEAVGKTGNGVLTQVFVDNDKEIVYIAIINTYLAKATGDYNEKKDEATYETWNLGWSTSRDHLVKTNSKMNLTVSGEDFDITEVKEDDIVLVHVADGEIQEFVDPEVIDSTEISSFKDGDWVNAEGTQYDYASTAKYDDEVLDEYDQTNMKDTTYRIYLDEYGYLIGIEIIEEPNQYLFLTGLDTTAYNLGNKRATANVLFLDGTSDTVTVNLEKSKAYKDSIKWKSGTTISYALDASPLEDPFTSFVQASLWNTWCTYSVDENGVYTLTEVASTDKGFNSNDSGKSWNLASTKRTTDKVGQGHNNNVAANTKIDTKRIGLDGIATPGYDTVYGNDESIYLVASLKRINDAKDLRPKENATDKVAIIIDGVDSVITGVRNASLDVFTLAQIETTDDYAYDISGDKTGDGSNKATNDATLNNYNTSNGVYTLFDDDGYVIAAVVVGEDNGTTTNYAYAYGDYANKTNGAIIKESYSKETKNWTWEAQAIVNGEDVVLTEVGDGLSQLKTMQPNNWYEVKYKADGTVKSVTEIARGTDGNGTSTDLTSHTYDAKIFCTDTHGANGAVDLSGGHISGSKQVYPKFVGKIEHVKQSNIDNDGKLVLFEDLTLNGNGGNAYVISAKANTLQVTNDTDYFGVDKGFSVSASAKVWLIQDDWANVDNNLKAMNTVINCGEGQSGLKKAITNLNLYDARVANDSADFNGFISAVFENGMATTVIIYEINANLIDQGTETVNRGQELNILSSVYDVNEALEKNNVVIPGDWVPAVDGRTRTLVIPANRTLTIKGNFNAVIQNVGVRGLSTASSKLVVEEAYTMSYTTSPQVNYKVEAGVVDIDAVVGTTPVIAADMTINGGVPGWAPVSLRIEQSGAPYDLRIASGVEVIVTGNVVNAGSAVDILVDGTLDVTGNIGASGGGVINATVTSVNSLHVRGAGNAMYGDLTLENGKAEVTKLDGDLIIVVGQATVTNEITGDATVTNGEIKVGEMKSGKTLILDGGKAEVGTMAAEVKLQNEDATKNNELVITETISGAITQITEGDKITVAAGATTSSDAATTLGSIDGTATTATTVTAAEDAGSAEGSTPVTVPVEVTDDTVESSVAADDRYTTAYTAAGVTSTIDGKTITINVNSATMRAQTSQSAIYPMYPTSPNGEAHTLYYGLVFTAPTVAGTTFESMKIMSSGYTTPDYTAEGVYHEYFTVGTGVAGDGDTVTLTPTTSANHELAIRWIYADGSVVNETYTVKVVVA